MGWAIVKQPNGLLARFSTVVDDFTHMDMTEEEALEVCREHMGRHDAKEMVARGLRDKPNPLLFEASGRNDGLDRWRHSLETIELIHGPEVRARRETFDVE